MKKTKEAIPFFASAVLESGAFLYSKANEAMQAHSAAGATRMRTTPVSSVRFGKQFGSRSLRLIGVCLAATLFMGLCASCGWSQQSHEKSHEMELSRSVRPWEFLPVTGMRAGLLGQRAAAKTCLG